MPKMKLGRKGVSSAIAAVLLIVGLVVGAGVGYASTSGGKGTTVTSPGSTVTASGGGGSTVTVTTTAAGSGGATATTTVGGGGGGGLSGTVNIGVLDDLTDGLSGEGIKINYTAYQAVNDINAYLATTAYAGKLKFNVV